MPEPSAEVIPMDNRRFIIDDLARSGLVPEDFDLVPSEPAPALTPFLEKATVAHPDLTGYSIKYPDYTHKGYFPDFSVKRYANHPTHKYKGSAGVQHAFWCTSFDILLKSDTKFIVEGEKKALAFMKYLEVPTVGIRGCYGWGQKEGGEGGIIPQLGSIFKTDHNIFVLLDGDFMTHHQIKVAAGTLARQIATRGAHPIFVILPPYPNGKRMGADDWIMSQKDKSKAALRRAFDELEICDWHELPESPRFMQQRLKLMTTVDAKGNEKVIRNEENTALVMEDIFGKDALFTDQYKGACFAPWGQSPKSYTDDTLDSALYRYIERTFGTWSKDAFRSQRRAMVGMTKRNLLGEQIASYKWDGVPRVETFLIKYYKAKDTEYTRKVSKGFLLGAIARCFHPGTKWDHVLILEGDQRTGKSYGLELLCYQHYVNVPMNGDATALARLSCSAWFVNCDELDHMTKAGREAFKSWVSNCYENWVPKYIEYAKETPRPFIITGTTNEATYLNDPTGAQRFWPVKLTDKADLDGIKRDRDQLWAEALVLFNKGGETWWREFENDRTGALEEQGEREQDDPLADVLEANLATHNLPTFSHMGEHFPFVTYNWCMSVMVNSSLPFSKKNAHQLSDSLKRCGMMRVRIRAKKIDMDSLQQPCRDGSTVLVLWDQFIEGHIATQLWAYVKKDGRLMDLHTREDTK